MPRTRQCGRVSRRLLALVLAVPVLIGAAAAPATSPSDARAAGVRFAPNAPAEKAASTNWAGYAVSGADPSTGAAIAYRAVSASWVQPGASCTPGAAAYASFWVGLGGFADGSQALEQIGTSSDCSAAGNASYYVWYELVPAAAVRLKLKVAAGDSISAVVVVSGRSVTLRLRNVTRRTVFTKRLTMNVQPDVSSAEWIAEAPSSCDASWRCRVLPLSNFGTVTFSGAAAATTSAHSGTISDTTWTATPIELLPDSSLRSPPLGAARPSDLSPDGTVFSVAWRDAAAEPRVVQ